MSNYLRDCNNTLGITNDEARQRLTRFGSNVLTPRKRSGSLALFLAQFKSPITPNTSLCSRIVFFLNENVNVFIILAIVFISSLLGFWQSEGLPMQSRSYLLSCK